MRLLKNRQPIALTIGGSDSSGGAGIQADLKAFAEIGVYGASVITSVTAQNTQRVQLIEPLPNKIITSQLDAVLTDLKPKAIKTGMLYSKEIVTLVADSLKDYKKQIKETKNDSVKIIVDPVITATTGKALIDQKDEHNQFIESLKTSLFPIATIITPNKIEAEQILGRALQTKNDMMNACSELHKFGSQSVLLKGGHATEKGDENFKNYAIDILYNGDFQTFKSPRIPKEVHGTGCTFASLITGFLVKGFDVPKAVALAKQLITGGIKNSLIVGDGIEVVNVIPKLGYRIGDDDIITEVIQAADELTTILKPNFIPEVGINIGYAKESAQSSEDICALTGRLVRVGEKVDYLGYAEFGASKHIARIILAAMDNDYKIRSAMNIKNRPEIIQVCKKLDFLVGEFDRTNEPKGVSSMEWGTKTVIDKLGQVPDIIYDTGGHGKEPMIRILGEDPKNVLEKFKKIFENLQLKEA